ncbi:hypothetical protein QN344_03850 [Mucilaginibacter sp. 5B2]|nr:hypothetical protein [Mucilaginibacter sp. 5B2]
MITIANVIEVCEIVNQASSKLTMLIGEPVELRLIQPEIQLAYNTVLQSIDKDMMIFNITDTVCAQYMTNIGKVCSTSKSSPLPDARKIIACLMAKYIDDITDQEIADVLNMDRSTAHYNRTKALELLQTNSAFRFQYHQVIKRLKSNLL